MPVTKCTHQLIYIYMYSNIYIYMYISGDWVTVSKFLVNSVNNIQHTLLLRQIKLTEGVLMIFCQNISFSCCKLKSQKIRFFFKCILLEHFFFSCVGENNFTNKITFLKRLSHPGMISDSNKVLTLVCRVFREQNFTYFRFHSLKGRKRWVLHSKKGPLPSLKI